MTRHDPLWMHAGRWGRWCICSCGWTSRNGTPVFAQLAFGRHLLEVEKVPTTPDNSPQSDEQGADLLADPDAGSGPQNGGKR